MALRLNRFFMAGTGVMALGWLTAAAGGWHVLGSAGGSEPSAQAVAQAATDKPASAQNEITDDPMGPNGACYVCHMTFVKEDLAKTHLAHKIACAKCHGLSDKHANDENIGATKPDITYRRDEVDASCQKCHVGHDVSARKVVARFLERKLSPQVEAACTDCHGAHKIDRSQTGK